ncbi:MAG: DUF5685 family protein [Oscillospiraceae bacterium]
MFGYVRPLKSELKIREFGQFEAAYCGLCHTLGRKYGVFSRFILNYDLTFLSLLLWRDGSQLQFEKKRCIVSPLRKKCVCCSCHAMNACAAYSVILSYWKLMDSMRDDGFFRSFPSRVAAIFLRSAYRKASADFPDFSLTAAASLSELSELERAGEPSIDRAADKFAQILAAAAIDEDDADKRRILTQLLYHLGRWIYIVDARNDIAEDIRNRNYNPVVSHYNLKSKPGGGQDAELKTTLQHSRNLMIAAFELLPENAWTGILRNIMYLGMDKVSGDVFTGTFIRARRSRKIRLEKDI